MHGLGKQKHSLCETKTFTLRNENGLFPTNMGYEGAIRLSFGKLLDDLLQVFKRTNTPLIP